MPAPEPFCTLEIPSTTVTVRQGTEEDGRIFTLDGMALHFFLANEFGDKEVTNIQHAEAVQAFWERTEPDAPPMPPAVALAMLTASDRVVEAVKKNLGVRPTSPASTVSAP